MDVISIYFTMGRPFPSKLPLYLSYLSYSEADFQVFRPAGATRCTDGVKFGTKEGTVPSFMPNFTPIGATIRAQDPKTEIFIEI